MLTDDEIYGHATGMLNAAGGIYADSVILINNWDNPKLEEALKSIDGIG